MNTEVAFAERPVKPQATILIADRNPHVRAFLAREMRVEGFRIRLARNCKELLKWLYHPEPLDLIILDPDLPDEGGQEILLKLYDRIPAIPVVVHSWSADYVRPPDESDSVWYVQKEGSSIEELKRRVHTILNKRMRID